VSVQIEEARMRSLPDTAILTAPDSDRHVSITQADDSWRHPTGQPAQPL